MVTLLEEYLGKIKAASINICEEHAQTARASSTTALS
jgi:hypothetical protein